MSTDIVYADVAKEVLDVGVSKQKVAQNRQAIIEAAERLFRERGVEAVGLVELMAAAGLTRGGFYNHFASKAALVEEVVIRAMADGGEQLAATLDSSRQRGTDPIEDEIDWYLSARHRADIGNGCPNAGFLGDAPRLDGEARSQYAAGLSANLRRFSAAIQQETGLDEEEAWAHALAWFGQMAGALLLSRAVSAEDPDLSDQLLAAARQDLLARTRKV
ncbi:TetR/AcrR family transcriptional regulator [Streptomyces sp. NPDC093228]|uniref:TetR/AcrR family transcriptional regulator n=1 Tax=Streptomyces sp. NPDC093228 TaxID=3155070 RepID=UPI00344133CA